MTKLKAANVFFFQWFFVRLTRCSEEVTQKYTVINFDSRFNEDVEGVVIKKEMCWYSIQYWILPLSGWGSNFVYLNKNPKFIKLTKPKVKL